MYNEYERETHSDNIEHLDNLNSKGKQPKEQAQDDAVYQNTHDFGIDETTEQSSYFNTNDFSWDMPDEDCFEGIHQDIHNIHTTHSDAPELNKSGVDEDKSADISMNRPG